MKLLTKTNTVLIGIKLKITVLLKIPLESAVNQIIVLVSDSGSGNTQTNFLFIFCKRVSINSAVYIIKSAA